MLDDKFITKEGFLDPQGQERPTYKVVSYHYFRLRLLQSEVLQVLQHRQSQQARASGANEGNIYMHTKLSSPFLAKFSSFRAWRVDIDRRLAEWKDSAPTQLDTGVQFSPLFLELNYWQAVIMLYRQSLAVPDGLVNELGSTDGSVGSPSMTNLEEREDEELVFLKVAEAGQKVLKLYRSVLALSFLLAAPRSMALAYLHYVAIFVTLEWDVDNRVIPTCCEELGRMMFGAAWTSHSRITARLGKSIDVPLDNFTECTSSTIRFWQHTICSWRVGQPTDVHCARD